MSRVFLNPKYHTTSLEESLFLDFAINHLNQRGSLETATEDGNPSDVRHIEVIVDFLQKDALRITPIKDNLLELGIQLLPNEEYTGNICEVKPLVDGIFFRIGGIHGYQTVDYTLMYSPNKPIR